MKTNATSTLLSSQGISFNIERPQYGWAGVKTRLILTVPRAQHPQAEAILSAAVEQSVVDKGEGMKGWIPSDICDCDVGSAYRNLE